VVVVGGGGVATAVQTVPDVAPVSVSQRATTGTQLTLQTLHLLCTHTHTHTHTFNDPLSRTIQESWY